MTIPHLQKPGAGLPFIEGIVIRYIYYPLAMRRFSWLGSLREMVADTEKIIALVQPLSETQFKTRVLIDRLTALEDSSRYWSAAMTLDHLMITMRGMTHIVAELAAGRPFINKTGTADVKPDADTLPLKEEMIVTFRQCAADCAARLMPLAAAAAAGNKAQHPFFGMIPARGWVFVLGAHQKLHRVQIAKIIKGLPNA